MILDTTAPLANPWAPNRDDLETIDDLKNIARAFKLYGQPHFYDAFSERQLKSKTWLKHQLIECFGNRFDVVFVLAGWVGVMAHLLLKSQRLEIQKLRSIDIDQNCEPFANCLNMKWLKNDWQFKAATADIVTINYENPELMVKRADGSNCVLRERPGLIINTSCEHLSDLNGWWQKIPDGMPMVLQGSDDADEPTHVHPFENLSSFLQQFPLGQLRFSGALNLGVSRRFMAIGIK